MDFLTGYWGFLARLAAGAPVDVAVEVLAVRDDAMQRGLNGDLTERLGLAVAVRAGDVDIVLNSIRQQVFSTECFTELGVDLRTKALVVVKSIQHFRASFDAIAAATLSCNAPGSLDVSLQNLSYRHLRRPICPRAFGVCCPTVEPERTGTSYAPATSRSTWAAGSSAAPAAMYN